MLTNKPTWQDVEDHLRPIQGRYKAALVDVYDTAQAANLMLGSLADSHTAADLVSLTTLIMRRLELIETANETSNN
jgi:hypothetical protein